MTTRFASVLFDCDSTLSAIEGIDELAVHHRGEIAELTDAAMRGEVRLEDVYGRRLAIVRPTRREIHALGARYVERLVPDARETVAALRASGVDVRIVSGGIRQAVLVLARVLGVSDDRVAAVDVYFDDAGAFAGYDASSPLTRSGGKVEIIARWERELSRPAMFVGDGVTDLETKGHVDRFVAFAGVVARAAVVAGADDVVRAPSLAPILPLALGEPCPFDPSSEWRAMYDRGVALLRSSR